MRTDGDWRENRQADMTQAIVAFPNFAKAPKKPSKISLTWEVMLVVLKDIDYVSHVNSPSCKLVGFHIVLSGKNTVIILWHMFQFYTII